MQDLALKRNFGLRQSLSSLHDKTAAWFGLGASIMGLWAQWKVRTARGGIILIAAWFGCLFALGYTTQNLLVVDYAESSDVALQNLAELVPNVTLNR